MYSMLYVCMPCMCMMHDVHACSVSFLTLFEHSGFSSIPLLKSNTKSHLIFTSHYFIFVLFNTVPVVLDHKLYC